jgi:hypothetical protein
VNALLTPTVSSSGLQIKIVYRFHILTVATPFISFRDIYFYGWVLFAPFLAYTFNALRIKLTSRFAMVVKEIVSSRFKLFALGASFVSLWNNLFGLCCRAARFTVVNKSIAHSTISLKKLRGNRKKLVAFATLLLRWIREYTIHTLSLLTCLASRPGVLPAPLGLNNYSSKYTTNQHCKPVYAIKGGLVQC